MKNEKNEREIEMQGEKNAAAELNRGRRVAAELAKCAIFVVLMIVSAFIKIPFPLVPLTFQTVVAGLLLGPLYGTAAVGVYIFMGLIGLPVFTSGGGFAYVVQPTFGYILGFAAAAFVAGALCGRGKAAQITLRGALLASVAGFLVNYIVGVPYFLLIWHFYMHNGGVWQAAVTYNLIYMPKDLALCLLAGFLAWRVRPLLDRLR